MEHTSHTELIVACDEMVVAQVQMMMVVVPFHFSFQMMASSMCSIDGPQSQWDVIPSSPGMDVLHLGPADLPLSALALSPAAWSDPTTVFWDFEDSLRGIHGR